jgi:hypothetical protein
LKKFGPEMKIIGHVVIAKDRVQVSYEALSVEPNRVFLIKIDLG